jgi:hypothetical protein
VNHLRTAVITSGRHDHPESLPNGRKYDVRAVDGRWLLDGLPSYGAEVGATEDYGPDVPAEEL